MSKGILITGATGKQGGATLDALVASPSSASEFTILAVTRSPTSASAQKLPSKGPNVKVVKGDLNDVPALFKSAKEVHPNIWGVFSVQVPMGKGQTTENEEKQGKALVDEALANGVKRFVYTSVDRGGDDSFSNPTNVPHFISKHNIEQHLVEKTKGTDMSYTILRPVAFMENFSPGIFGKLFGTAWQVRLPAERSLQLVSVADIGHFAAQAFVESEQYKNRAIGLAGDDLTFSQVNEVFKQKTGAPAPTTFGFLGSGLLWGVKEMGTMFDWFVNVGYGAKPTELRKEHPGMLTLGDWIEKKSTFKRQSDAES